MSANEVVGNGENAEETSGVDQKVAMHESKIGNWFVCFCALLDVGQTKNNETNAPRTDRRILTLGQFDLKDEREHTGRDGFKVRRGATTIV